MNMKPHLCRTVSLAGLLALAGCSGFSGHQADATGRPSGTGVPLQTAPASAPKPSPASATAVQDPVRIKMASMTLEEKLGQMILAGIEGGEMDAEAKAMIARHQVGGIILYAANIADLNGMVSLINSLKTANAGGPAPLFISVDQEGGKVSRLPSAYATIPSNETVGKSKNAELAGTMGRLIARELRSAGFNMDFAPVLDVNSNPNNPVIGDRSFGPTASIVTELGIAEMKGVREEGVIPVVKHYPGHGDTSMDSHLELPVVRKTAAQLQRLEWLPFEAAVRERADAVMVAHILYPALDSDKPASLSKAIIGGELRGRLGYNGVVITDDLGMGAIKHNYDLASAAVSSVLAGSDILLVAHGYRDVQLVFDTLLQNVKNGTVTEARIDESVYRILCLKSKYKLTDTAMGIPDLTELNREITAWRKRL